MWAVIGGSGFEKFDEFKAVENLSRETPFGETSIGFKKVELDGTELLFIPRHGTEHDRLPTEVNYRANIFALKKYGARKLLTFSAVGSLQNECAPGELVIPNQFIDRTKGIRGSTFCGDGIVGHVSLANPINSVMESSLETLSGSFDFKTHFNKKLVVMEGPQFSTKAESHLYRSWGADIIGMTSYPEYALAREAGLAYLNCCFVTDYDCWKDDIPHVTVEQVIQVMRANNKKAFQVAKAMFHLDSKELQETSEIENGLKNALMSSEDQMTTVQKAWLEVLTK